MNPTICKALHIFGVRGVGLVIKIPHLHNPIHAYKLGRQISRQRYNVFFTLEINLLHTDLKHLLVPTHLPCFLPDTITIIPTADPHHTYFDLGRTGKWKENNEGYRA